MEMVFVTFGDSTYVVEMTRKEFTLWVLENPGELHLVHREETPDSKKELPLAIIGNEGYETYIMP